ncbi:MAG: hypothetical protein KGL39_32210 [Patescibacteria group bacterium]|nr:hypothetical protein [Patescibacteria group bacterium]
MSEIDVHTQKFAQGSALPAQQDRLANYVAYGIANGSGGAGATVTVAVTVPGNQLPASGNYFVDYDLPADYTVFTTAKTAAGFTVNLQPRLASNSVAAGTFNLWVTW